MEGLVGLVSEMDDKAAYPTARLAMVPVESAQCAFLIQHREEIMEKYGALLAPTLNPAERR
eukprot:457155-Prymnesium_polylepis.2